MTRKLFFIATWTLLVGCSSTVIVEQRELIDPQSSWARVLKKFVNHDGLVNFTDLSRDRKDLEDYIYYLSQASPEKTPHEFPDEASKLAYYLNAHNAFSMYNVLNFDIPADNGTFFKRFRFFYLTKFSMGGNEVSLYGLVNDFIRPVGDARVHVALDCMARSCPRLLNEPFDPKRLDAQLNAQAKQFYNDRRNIALVSEEKQVHVTEMLDFFTDDFLKTSPSLIAYINQYRPESEKIPEDYEVEFVDYDWTLHTQ